MTSGTARRLIATTICLAAAWLYLSVEFRAEVVPVLSPLDTLPMQIEGWRGRREPDFDGRLVALLGADDYIVRNYVYGDGAPVGLYVGYYASQRQGDTIHSPLNCLPGAGWQPIQQDRIRFAAPDAPSVNVGAAPIEVNRVLVEKGLDRALVIYWYQTHARVVASEYWGKVYTVLDAVRYNRTDAAFVRVITPVGEGDSALEEADLRARAFVQGLLRVIADYVPA